MRFLNSDATLSSNVQKCLNPEKTFNKKFPQNVYLGKSKSVWKHLPEIFCPKTHIIPAQSPKTIDGKLFHAKDSSPKCSPG